MIGVQKSKFKGISVLPNICQYNLKTGQLLRKFSNSRIAAESLDSNKNVLTRAGRIFSICKAAKGHAYGYI